MTPPRIDIDVPPILCDSPFYIGHRRMICFPSKLWAYHSSCIISQSSARDLRFLLSSLVCISQVFCSSCMVHGSIPFHSHSLAGSESGSGSVVGSLVPMVGFISGMGGEDFGSFYLAMTVLIIIHPSIHCHSIPFSFQLSHSTYLAPYTSDDLSS